MTKKRKIDGDVVAIALFFAFILFLAGMAVYTISQQETTTKRVNLWAAECPFGHYWTDIEGGGFIVFFLSSYPSEAYTLKFIDDGILKTLIVESTDDAVRVVLEDSLDDFYIYLRFEGTTIETDPLAGSRDLGDIYWIYIHVPDPKLFAEEAI